jgi:hypothetical protein
MTRLHRRSCSRFLPIAITLGLVTQAAAVFADEPKPAEPPAEAAKAQETKPDPKAAPPEEKKADAPAEKKDEKADADKKPLAELTTLRLLHEKGVINDAEYEAAIKEIGESNGLRAPDSNTLVVGKFATTLYGFVEADGIYDSTQTYNETPGNAQIARAGTYAGDHDRTQMSIRNSRIGIRSKAPEYHGIRASAQLEMDFLGTQLPIAPQGTTASAPYNGSEAAFFSNPTFRARHVNLKVETPYVDVLFGQYWALFGWGAGYHPNTVEIQGVPGELYQRNVQLRLSKTVKTDAVTFEAAIAGLRPPQRDSGVPEGQAGIRVAYNKWTGVQTVGSTNTQVSPLSIAVTGDARQVRMPELLASPKDVKQRVATALAVDGFLPIIPGEKGKMGNSLALNGEFASGYGTADLYTGLGATGTAYPALPNPTNLSPAPVYQPDMDPGIVQYDSNGGLHYIQWSSWLVGVQYYLPGLNGHVWVSGNYSHMTSSNIQQFGPAAKVRSDLDWFDVNLFADLTPAVRVAAEYANTHDKYADGTNAVNHRAQFSMFYIF